MSKVSFGQVLKMDESGMLFKLTCTPNPGQKQFNQQQLKQLQVIIEDKLVFKSQLVLSQYNNLNEKMEAVYAELTSDLIIQSQDTNHFELLFIIEGQRIPHNLTSKDLAPYKEFNLHGTFQEMSAATPMTGRASGSKFRLSYQYGLLLCKSESSPAYFDPEVCDLTKMLG